MTRRRPLAGLALLALLVSCGGSADLEQTSASTVKPVSSSNPERVVDPVDAMADVTTCAELAVLVVDGLQAHVDRFALASPQQVAELSTELRPELQQLATTAGDTADTIGCTGADYRSLLTAELGRLDQGSGVQRAVAGTFIGGRLGGDDPSDPGANEFEVATGAELGAAVRSAGTGSIIRLAPGEYAIDSSLVLLRGVTLIGSGTDATTITSTAPGAAVLVATSATVTLEAFTVINEVPDASVIAVTRGGLTLRDAAVEGGRRNADGNGGFGLILAPDTTLEVGSQAVADTVFRDNDGGGILVDGSVRPELARLEVEATTGCAVCWRGESGGSLDGATITGGDVALRVEGTASPVIRDVSATDADIGAVIIGSATPSIFDTQFEGSDAGMAIGEAAAPELVRVTLSNSTDVGLRLGGTSTAMVTDVAITGSPAAGIGILEQAAPIISGGTVESTGEVGVLYTGSAMGALISLTVRGSRIGIQISEDAAPTLSAIVATAIGEAAALVLERGAGTIESMQCDGDDTGVIGLQTEGDITISEDIDCRVVQAG